MGQERRFLITRSDAEIIILALTAALDKISMDDDFRNSAYWGFTKLTMERLRERLITYQWYKE